VASGDYSTANTDAQAAYSESQTVAGEGGPDNTDETWNAQLDESWANSDQETATEDQTTAESYAAAGFTDDAQMYSEDGTAEEQTADGSAEAGEYGDPVGEPVDTPVDDSAPAEEAPAEEAPVDDAPADDTTVDDDSSAG